MLKNIADLERKYGIGIEADSGYIFLYSPEFEDADVKKFHTAIICPEENQVNIEYNHIFDDYHQGYGIVSWTNGLTRFVNQDMWELCNHWSLYSLREQGYIEIFKDKIADFLREVLGIEEI